jgi:hypothetical protein
MSIHRIKSLRHSGFAKAKSIITHTDPYHAKILRHVDLVIASGKRVALVAEVGERGFWTQLLGSHLQAGEVILVSDNAAEFPDAIRVDDFLRDVAVLNCGAVLVAVRDFGEHMKSKKKLGNLQKQDVIVVNVLGYSAIPQRPEVPWAEQGLTYPGIFEVVGRYAQSLDCPQKSYVEFGCFEGHTLSCAYHILSVYGVERFIVFDSFGGLIGTNDDERAVFSDGDYSASLQSVEHNLRAANCDLSRFTMVQGDIRTTAVRMNSMPGNVAVAYIDVDIYEPAKAALDALTEKLAPGAILMFDDFDCMGATNEAGERRALLEWLQENPSVTVEPFRNYATFGRSFIVHKGKSARLAKHYIANNVNPS